MKQLNQEREKHTHTYNPTKEKEGAEENNKNSKNCGLLKLLVR